MDRQEITEELGHPGARNLLDSATLLRLAYHGSDGFLRMIPIGVYRNGNQIVICTAATAPTVQALSSRRTSRAARSRRDALLEQHGVPEVWRRSIAEALDVIDLLDARIGPLDCAVGPLARADARVVLLDTIPGVGDLLGLTLASEIVTSPASARHAR